MVKLIICKMSHNMDCSNKSPESDKKAVRKSAYQKRYYAENKQRILARQKRWRTNNAERVSSYRRKYRENNGERINERWKQYYAKKQGTDQSKTPR